MMQKDRRRGKSPANFIDLTGRTFTRLTVLGIGDKTPGRLKWECRCSCGDIRLVPTNKLKSGHTRSCGCWKNDMFLARFTTHGRSKTPEYRSYCHAKERCTNPKSADWHRYGGRGIEFRFDSFEAFLAEVGIRPTPSHSIDRINNDGHYEPGNVRWATARQQARNRGTSAQPRPVCSGSSPARSCRRR